MKRRDALKGAFAGLVAGTALSAEQPAQHPNLSWGPQPHYYVLYVFQHVPCEFIPVGIYTKRADAEEHEKRARASMEKFAGAIVERSHEEFCYETANIRLGAMAEHMRKFLKEPVPRNEYGVDLREHREIAALYSGPGFPVAVAQKG